MEKSQAKGELIRYSSKRSNNRRGGYRGFYHGPYNHRRYSPYRAKAGRYTPRYRMSSRVYEGEPTEEIGPQYNSPPESRYAQRMEKQLKDQEAGELRSSPSGQGFPGRYPPSFPEHWVEGFRKEVMSGIYEQHAESAMRKALAEKSEAEGKTGAGGEIPRKSEDQDSEDFRQDAQERLLEIIGNKGFESTEGKAAYEELMRIQHEELNRLEAEYWGEKDRRDTKAKVENSADKDTSKEESRVEPELGSPEVERTLNQIEGELFAEPEAERSEVDGAERLAEQALEMGESEIEDLVHTAIEETKIESSELGAEPGYEIEAGEEDVEVY